MSHIKKIRFVNFKAISEQEVNFNGCTAIITAGNDKGKTSFLKGMMDRIRFIRPNTPVKKGQTEGKGEMVLDTGEKFIWEFDVNGKDKILYIDQNQVKQSLTKEMGKDFFPPTFDIDVFLNSGPKDQVKQLQKIVGIDFTEIDERYKKAYDLRTSKNADAEKYHVKLSQMLKVPFVAFVNLDELQAKKEAIRVKLNDLYRANKAHNEKLRNDWNAHKESVDKVCNENNTASDQREIVRNTLKDHASNLKDWFYPKADDIFKWIDEAHPVIVKVNPLYDLEPEYIEEMPDASEMTAIDDQILKASQINVEAQKYVDYIEYKKATELANVEADEANALVVSIESERKRMIESANFPKGLSINLDGAITVDGYVMEKNQISTSKMYTTALRIAAMNLGEIKALYFDASYLDNNTLKEIEDWAKVHNLQLLIEQPDKSGGEITYELIEN